MLRNSTNLPDRLVAIALAFAFDELRGEGCEPPLLVTVKNKHRGKFKGRWGWYYPEDRHVVIIMPRNIPRPTSVFRKYSRMRITIRNRVDFLVCILAHELRHTYQWQKWTDPRSSWRLRREPIAKIARETDAELYEARVLEKWHKFTCEVSLAGI